MSTLSVLLILMEDDIREMLTSLLAGSEEPLFRTFSAASGEEGLALLSENRPQVVLIGANLPRMTGLEVLDLLSSSDVYKDIPTVFLVDSGQEILAVQAIKLGATDFLVSGTIDPELVRRTLRHAVEQKRAECARLEQQDFVRTLLDTIPNPIYYKDILGRYMGGNRAFEHFIGIGRESLLNRTADDIFEPEFAEWEARQDAELVHSPGTRVTEKTLVLPGGGKRRVCFHRATFLDARGMVAGMVGVIMDITEHRLAEQQMRILSLQDEVTGVANRRHMNLFLKREWGRAVRDGVPISLVMVDVDHFKRFNDEYGHQAGDQCLAKVARTLRACLHRSCDLVARYGGEEFAVVLPGTPWPGAIHVAEVMRRAMEDLKIPNEGSSVSPYVTLSLGIATLRPEASSTPEDLIALADAALYTAKQEGRNRVEMYGVTPPVATTKA